MNARSGQPGLGFYRLVPLLRREAELVDVSVSADDLHGDRRATSDALDSRLQTAWDYMDKEISTSKFLRICSSMYRSADR